MRKQKRKEAEKEEDFEADTRWIVLLKCDWRDPLYSFSKHEQGKID